jgi:MarR family transcriptional regulator for hemolysin
MDDMLAPFGLTEATAVPLVSISRIGEGVRQNALAEALRIEGPSLVRVLDHLCAAGLVERREDCADRRAKTLHLTETGRETTARIETALAA